MHVSVQPRKAHLVLQDGQSFPGYSFGYEGSSAGELVFNTGLVGWVRGVCVCVFPAGLGCCFTLCTMAHRVLDLQ